MTRKKSLMAASSFSGDGPLYVAGAVDGEAEEGEVVPVCRAILLDSEVVAAEEDSEVVDEVSPVVVRDKLMPRN
jgi:hypothetical protein